MKKENINSGVIDEIFKPLNSPRQDQIHFEDDSSPPDKIFINMTSEMTGRLVAPKVESFQFESTYEFRKRCTSSFDPTQVVEIIPNIRTSGFIICVQRQDPYFFFLLKGKTRLVKNVTEIKDLDKQCILMHIRTKSDEK